jgi:hypothetical protein
VFGSARFENIEPSASFTVTSIFLVALAVLGVIAAVRRVRARATDDATSDAAMFRVLLLAGAAAAASTLAIADLFERYEGDFVPTLLVASAVGLCWLFMLIEGRERWVRRLVGGALIVFAVWSCWATFSLTIIYQREYSAFQDTAVRAGFLDFQLDLNEALGLGSRGVRHGSSLPVVEGRIARRTNAPHGELFVLDKCRALYVASGRTWETIEEPAPGSKRLRVTFERAPRGTRQPLWSAGTGPYQILWARWVDDDHVAFDYEWSGAPEAASTGRVSFQVEPGRAYDLDVRLDPPYIGIAHDGTTLFSDFASTFDTAAPARVGEQPDPSLGPTRFPGRIRRLSATPVCDRLAG